MSLWTHIEMQAATLGRASEVFAVNGVSIDTRSLRPGDLFVALKGDTRDGHAFVDAAFAAGAAAALVTHRPDGVQGPLLVVAHTQRALEDLARAARARSRARVIAVTGSAGKTTTKEILRIALGALAPTHVSAASYNNHWGVPLSLATLPKDAAYGVFEVGMNHFGELRGLVGFVRPHVAMVTTVAAAHLAFFGTVEAIADAKSEIFEGLEPGGVALVPADNPHAARLVARAHQAGVDRIVTFGEKGEARLLGFAPDAAGMRVKADILGTPVDCLVGAPGAHIAANVVGALAAVALVGGDVRVASGALRTFMPLAGRGARFSVGGIHVIDESYNANPASMSAALALLGQAQPIKGKQGRRIAVLGDMLEMGEGSLRHHAALAEPIARNHVDLVFLAGGQMKALWDTLPKAVRGAWAPDSGELATVLMDRLVPGDTVLVKGSNGARMVRVIDALKAGTRQKDKAG